MGTSRGEALVNYAQALQDSQNQFSNQLFRAQETYKKKQNKGGLWRTLLGLGAFAAGTMMGMPQLGIAALSGLGSFAGSKLGENLVHGRTKVGTNLMFGKQKAVEANRGLSQMLRDYHNAQAIGALTDAFSAYTAGKTFPGLKQDILEAADWVNSFIPRGNSSLNVLDLAGPEIGSIKGR